MRKHELYSNYHDHFEYFGNTEIERIRKQGENTIRHDWIIFDTVDEAMGFFNDRCGEFNRCRVELTDVRSPWVS